MPNTTVSGIVAPSGAPEKYAAPTTGVLDTSFMIVTYPLMVPLVPTIVTVALRNNAEWQDQNPSFTTPAKLPAGQTSSVPAYAAPPAGGGTANPPAGELVHATGCTAGAPGTWTPGGCQIPVSIVDAPRPTVLTNWTVGQYIVLRGGGTANEINWNGTAYVAGRHA
jgi:hypothetical protein